MPIHRKSTAEPSNSSALTSALAGFMAMAAALGIGRFVYTPILPHMMATLGWSKADAGLVASANFLGYFLGALLAGRAFVAAAPRAWLLVAVVISAATTAASGLTESLELIMAIRFAAGIASACVIVCASTLVIDRLVTLGRPGLAAVHFAGVGSGILVSAVLMAVCAAHATPWSAMWLWSGAIAAVMALVAIILTPRNPPRRVVLEGGERLRLDVPARRMILAYGLFGFGYVITATFLVAIVRQDPAVRPLEPWIWILVGLAAIPSVPLWQWLSRRLGLTAAYAVACLVEAAGVLASVDWVSTTGVVLSAVLLGGTFMGLTSLGLLTARALGGARPQPLIGAMTACFSVGQMLGPTVAGALAEQTGGLTWPSRLAALALVVGAVLAVSCGRIERR